jgi:hypothetical protein
MVYQNQTQIFKEKYLRERENIRIGDHTITNAKCHTWIIKPYCNFREKLLRDLLEMKASLFTVSTYCN